MAAFTVPDQPHFDSESLSYFMERLSRASEYLEFGSGGSTVEAAKRNKRFTTIESDGEFLSAVREKIGHNAGRLIHINIGRTGEWGAPISKRNTPWNRWRWARYARAPWDGQRWPDLILIDGRFRVHCALYAIRQLYGRDFEILFDDYTGRPFYHEVEQFAELKYFRGRMACFGPKSVDLKAIEKAIRLYAGDWR
jgi:hypothetical protein